MDLTRLANAGAREAAFLACLDYERHGRFLRESLELWQDAARPASRDFRLAQEVAYGVTRMRRALDWCAECLAARGELRMKRKERVLMRTALYQLFWMDRVPAYAVGRESVELAKKYCHRSFVSFLNALLRQQRPESEPENLAIRYSYPDHFVKLLRADTDIDDLEAVLKAMNCSPKLMARRRGPNLRMIQVDSTEVREGYIIQNSTPATLMYELAAKLARPPLRVLDLCAAPGGKTVLLADLFPEAELHANDPSERRWGRLHQTLEQQGLSVHEHMVRGEQFSNEQGFDVVVADVPCSNSGVLHKRPEARWRLDRNQLGQLRQLQWSILEQARDLLTEGGQLWYMTCSILRDEDNALIDDACRKLGWKRAGYERRILPSTEGADGGYACALTL